MPVVVTASDRIAVERSRGSTRRCCRTPPTVVDGTPGVVSVRDGDRVSRDRP
ncbi:hypothetical protein [Halorubellus salinus]|uniref:hypothetical protein n=1 Tax=Halorubellus salinus TaxID=755309 RepID=UPI001D06A362|nr:hypothetical protein [Halorubellus salinus]